MKHWLIAFIAFLNFQCLAHSGKQAHFKIEKSDSIYVTAEFPWTLRNALIEFDSTLIAARNQSEFHHAFYKYFPQNFQLLGIDKELIIPSRISLIPPKQSTHSHSVSYLIVYPNVEINCIKNKVMLSYNSSHTNFNSLQLQGKIKQFETNKNLQQFCLQEPKTESSIPIKLLMALGVLLGFIIYKKTKN